MTPEELNQSIFLLGPWLVGCYLEIFLQGVLMVQFFNYFNWYPEDMLNLKLAVVALVILTILKSIQSFALIWIQLILNFTELEAAINLNYTAWWQTGNSLMVAALCLFCQGFFCYRLYVISRKWVVVLPIAAIFLFGFVAVIIATYTIAISAYDQIGRWFAAHLSAVFAGDTILSFTTVWFLLRSKKNVLPQTQGLVSALVRLTFQSAAPAAICAMMNLIFSQIYDGTEKIISTTFNQMLPKLYAISMMYTLNARHSIRAVQSSAGPSSSHDAPRTRRTRRLSLDGMELGSMAPGTAVHVRTQTVQHVDGLDGPTYSSDKSQMYDLDDPMAGYKSDLKL